MTTEEKQVETPANLQTPDGKSIKELNSDLEKVMENFINIAGSANVNLTPKERQRLISAGVRNDGFIDSAFSIALANPRFLPNHLTKEGMALSIAEFDGFRQFMLTSKQLTRLSIDGYMVHANTSYHEGLQFYRNLGGQTKAKVSGAESLHLALKTFFTKRRKFFSKPEDDLKQLDGETGDIAAS